MNLKLISALIILPNLGHADGLTQDIKTIQQNEIKVLRCVLNKHPRCLSISLQPKLSVAYDTWRGALCLAWKPTDPKHPLKLEGAVFTGAHGPQPTTQGTTIFESFKPQYQCSDSSAKLTYLGHRIGDRGIVTLTFCFRSPSGENVATFEDSVTTTDKGGLTLYRRIQVTQLATGKNLTVSFPEALKWSQTTDQKATFKTTGSQTFSAKIR